MLLKIMSDEDIPDDDSRKGFTIIDKVREVACARITEENRTLLVEENAESSLKGRIGGPILEVLLDAEEGSERVRMIPAGNIYIFNDDGKLVSAFGVMEYVGHGEADNQGRPVPAEESRPGISGL